MATVREGVMAMPVPPLHKAKVVRETVHLTQDDQPIQILREQFQDKKVNLKASRVIVAGGAGLGSKENFRLVWDLAHCLGAAAAGTRAAVDLGFIDRDHQVGQTGTTVRPSLYVAIGPSAGSSRSSMSPTTRSSGT
jgi:electron transfer flavoprotein alpha subunit